MFLPNSFCTAKVCFAARVFGIIDVATFMNKDGSKSFRKVGVHFVGVD
jgi:hypothetical protein